MTREAKMLTIALLLACCACRCGVKIDSRPSDVTKAEAPAPAVEVVDPCCADADLLQTVTLDRISKAGLHVESGIIAPRDQEEIDGAIFQNMVLREWAKTVEPKCVRDAYLDWADYQDNQIASGREWLIERPKIRAKMDDDARRRREQLERSKECSFPSPPTLEPTP